MLRIVVPNEKPLTWYLAAEEFLAKNINRFTDDLFFTWVVDPTVIFGRHQVMENEVNLPYCKEHGIAVVRRKSGGGCVYADRGNLMLSAISRQPSAVSFQQFLNRMAEVLRGLGLDAVKTEHNDILVGGRKVSGNACYQLSDDSGMPVSVVHGTLLYDVDFEALQQAITPTEEKLKKHGVESVRQRVSNIKPLLKNSSQITDIQSLAQYLTDKICTDSITLAETDIENICLLKTLS